MKRSTIEAYQFPLDAVQLKDKKSQTIAKYLSQLALKIEENYSYSRRVRLELDNGKVYYQLWKDSTDIPKFRFSVNDYSIPDGRGAGAVLISKDGTGFGTAKNSTNQAPLSQYISFGMILAAAKKEKYTDLIEKLQEEINSSTLHTNETIYAVGNRIKIEEQQQLLGGLIVLSTVPTERKNIPKQEVINALRSCWSCEYFMNQDLAEAYALENQLFSSIGAVYEIEAERDIHSFILRSVKSATIPGTNHIYQFNEDEQDFNYFRTWIGNKWSCVYKIDQCIVHSENDREELQKMQKLYREGCINTQKW